MSLLILSCSIFLIAISPVVWAPAGEAYTLTISPPRLQESTSSQVVLSLKVTNATTFTTYSFTWTVTDPSGSSRTANNSTNSGFGTSFTLSTDFPKNFPPASLRYVGNYTVRVDETSPANKPNVASGHFQVGLTGGATYRRTDTTSIQGIGYQGWRECDNRHVLRLKPCSGLSKLGLCRLQRSTVIPLAIFSRSSNGSLQRNSPRINDSQGSS